MKIIEIDCGRCGAPLTPPIKMAEVECEYCGATVRVEREQDTAPKVEPAVSAEVQRIKDQLKSLDKRWRWTREGFMRADKHGHRSLPTQSAAWIMFLFAGLIITFLLTGTSDFGSTPPLMFIAPFVIILTGIYTLYRARQFNKLERQYKARRRKMHRELREAEKAA
jgi:uncharacterized Zn finger protein (UPF0148 family)